MSLLKDFEALCCKYVRECTGDDIRKQYEMYDQVIRCKDCKYYRGGDCWHEWDNEGRMYYQSIINEPNPDDYCSRAERKEE